MLQDVLQRHFVSYLRFEHTSKESRFRNLALSSSRSFFFFQFLLKKIRTSFLCGYRDPTSCDSKSKKHICFLAPWNDFQEGFPRSSFVKSVSFGGDHFNFPFPLNIMYKKVFSGARSNSFSAVILAQVGTFDLLSFLMSPQSCSSSALFRSAS